MARAQGAWAQMALEFETVYGTAPLSGYTRMPFASTSLGAQQPLLSSELLSYGHDPLAPVRDAVTADGDVVVPIDAEAFGFWLEAAFGAPPISGSGTGPVTHEFRSALGRCRRCRSRRRCPKCRAMRCTPAACSGYACYNDGSVRDWQRHTSQFMRGKTFAGTGGFGPWMVTTDEIPDPTSLKLTTRLNGQVVQQTTLDLMITSVPALVAYCSTILPLEPGDVIVSGTPGGVGAKRTPPLWMRAGDVAEVEITGIGTLSNPVVDEAALTAGAPAAATAEA